MVTANALFPTSSQYPLASHIITAESENKQNMQLILQIVGFLFEFLAMGLSNALVLWMAMYHQFFMVAFNGVLRDRLKLKSINSCLISVTSNCCIDH